MSCPRSLGTKAFIGNELKLPFNLKDSSSVFPKYQLHLNFATNFRVDFSESSYSTEQKMKNKLSIFYQ
jgi:hypothetical protein